MAKTPKLPPPPEATTIRWRPDDWQRIEALRKKTGIETVANLVRKALRDLAEKEGLQ